MNIVSWAIALPFFGKVFVQVSPSFASVLLIKLNTLELQNIQNNIHFSDQESGTSVNILFAVFMYLKWWLISPL